MNKGFALQVAESLLISIDAGGRGWVAGEIELTSHGRLTWLPTLTFKRTAVVFIDNGTSTVKRVGSEEAHPFGDLREAVKFAEAWAAEENVKGTGLVEAIREYVRVATVIDRSKAGSKERVEGWAELQQHIATIESALRAGSIVVKTPNATFAPHTAVLPPTQYLTRYVAEELLRSCRDQLMIALNEPVAIISINELWADFHPWYDVERQNETEQTWLKENTPEVKL